ncbi:hypothetical protein glysoja_045843 [Glycine soja]|uniref:Uncharacterized protein n=1 Tax=Glycine soja TaxID=3848 RepID=A0A0B2SJZ8_GLYSO|nr:hypothetical protein glysoja_045843 [Glycine soja]
MALFYSRILPSESPRFAPSWLASERHLAEEPMPRLNRHLGQTAKKMETEYRNMSGESHVCGLNSSGYLVCRGSNDFGQIDVPERDALEFFGLALGVEHT